MTPHEWEAFAILFFLASLVCYSITEIVIEWQRAYDTWDFLNMMFNTGYFFHVFLPTVMLIITLILITI